MQERVLDKRRNGKKGELFGGLGEELEAPEVEDALARIDAALATIPRKQRWGNVEELQREREKKREERKRSGCYC